MIAAEGGSPTAARPMPTTPTRRTTRPRCVTLSTPCSRAPRQLFRRRSRSAARSSGSADLPGPGGRDPIAARQERGVVSPSLTRTSLEKRRSALGQRLVDLRARAPGRSQRPSQARAAGSPQTLCPLLARSTSAACGNFRMGRLLPPGDDGLRQVVNEQPPRRESRAADPRREGYRARGSEASR